MLKGFNIKYSDGDHHILAQEIDLDVSRKGNNAVDVSVDFLLRDGWVQCVVIADLV